MKKLIILLGPTGVGKTDLSIDIASYFSSPIISCDSRQFYKEMRIGTAVPSDEQLALCEHKFIQIKSIFDYYSAAEFEREALEEMDVLFKNNDTLVMTGGSMMYIDAICRGMDAMPTISEELRCSLNELFKEKGLEYIRQMLKEQDPTYYEEVDLQNHKRILHALEICKTAGVPYSSLRKNQAKKRDFNIVLVGLNRDREELYNRINMRVDIMMEEGLEEEARSLYQYRELNALNTVGYKEMFAYFDGEIDKEEAVRLIQRNSRHYARRQLIWFRRNDKIQWFNPDDKEAVLEYCIKG